jgi:hypothetical protein
MKGQNASDEAVFLEEFSHGGEWLAQGDFSAAKLHLEQALRLNPDDERTQNLLGLTYFKLNLWKDAAQIYEVLIRANPEDATLHINLGLVFLKQNNTRHAILEFETAIGHQPDNKKAHNYLGLALAQDGEYARAHKHFLAAGSDVMALRMDQILGELAKPSKPTPEPSSRQEEEPVAQEKETLKDDVPQESNMAQESSMAGKPGATESPSAIEEPSAAEKPSAVEESGVAEASSAAQGMKEMVVPAKETVSADIAKVFEEWNQDSMDEALSELSSKLASGLPANAGAGFEGGSPKDREDVFPLPSAQRDSKPADQLWPSSAEEASGTGTKLSQMVAVLPWPKENSGLFQIEREVVTIAVQGELLTRLTGLLGAAGNLDAAPEMRRYRGRPTDSPFGMGQEQIQRLIGSGVLFFEKAATEFLSFSLDDGSLYLREENLFAFDEQLNFENGRLSGDEGWSIDMVHLKGEGRLLLRLKGVLRRIPVSSSVSLRVPVSQLVGWYGQLTPVLSSRVGRSTVVLSGMGSALISVASQRP